MAAENEMSKNEMVHELKEKFKDAVAKELFEDKRFFYRFLQACSFNIDNAEIMLRKHLELREKYDVANILKYEPPEVITKYLPFIKIGYDKEGSVVRYCPAGSIDWIGLILSVKPEDFIKKVILDIEEDVEEHKRQSEKLGTVVDKGFYIYNLDKLTFAQATTKKDSYKEDLLKIIDEDVLPGFLGGNRTDPDGNQLCPSFIGPVGAVPETYYIHKSKRSLASFPDVEKIVLTRATFHETFNEVTIPGSYLEWEFETKSRDVGFGLFYQVNVEGEDKMKEIVPIQRIDTEDYAEHGMYRCENPGTYVIVFDNTYSWIRAKEIYYRIKIVTPEEQKGNLEE